MDRVIVRFKRPSGGIGRQMPSAALNQAMVSLADTDEMRPLLSKASSEGKAFVIDIIQDCSGRPVFVHFTKEAL